MNTALGLHLVIASLFCQTSPIPTKYCGTYVNVGNDIQLNIMGPVYELQIGGPLSSPKSKRHVDFERGTSSLSEGKLTLTCSTTFKSPGRYSINDLYFGGMHCLFNTLFKTEAERKAGKAEMERRITPGGPSRTLHLVPQGNVLAFDLDGVILKKER